jgi:cytochrome c1
MDSNPRYFSVKQFSRPLQENLKSTLRKKLPEAQSTAYKPAYKDNSKTAQNQAVYLPHTLAEIVAACPQLPDVIHSAIIANTR